MSILFFSYTIDNQHLSFSLLIALNRLWAQAHNLLRSIKGDERRKMMISSDVIGGSCVENPVVGRPLLFDCTDFGYRF